MNSSELAAAMLQWEQEQAAADATRAAIEAAVLAIGKTQTVGRVRATFSAGRRTFDYQRAIDEAGQSGSLLPDSLAPYSSESVDYFAVVENAVSAGILPGEYVSQFATTNIDFAAACKGLGLEAPVIAQKPPSVTVKLV